MPFLFTYLIYDLKIGKACDRLTENEVVLPARVVSSPHRRALKCIFTDEFELLAVWREYISSERSGK